jgi:signal transduction histidine kinase
MNQRVLQVCLYTLPAIMIYAVMGWVFFFVIAPEASPLLVVFGEAKIAELTFFDVAPRFMIANAWIIIAWAGAYIYFTRAQQHGRRLPRLHDAPAHWFPAFQGAFWTLFVVQALSPSFSGRAESMQVSELAATLLLGVTLTFLTHACFTRLPIRTMGMQIGAAIGTVFLLSAAFALTYVLLAMPGTYEEFAPRFQKFLLRSFWPSAAWMAAYLALQMFFSAPPRDMPAQPIAPALPDWQRNITDQGSWFWQFQLFYWLGIGVFSQSQELVLSQQNEALWRLVIPLSAGLVTTTVIRSVLNWVFIRRFGSRIILGIVLCIPATLFYVLAVWVAYFEINSIIDTVLAKYDAAQHERVREFYQLHKVLLRWMLVYAWFFVGWLGIYLAIDYARRVKRQEGQLVAANALAHQAQLKALRFQLNPHFLFNTLNAISSLVIDKRNDDAEEMLMRLSRFLRTTIDANPTEKTTLAEELATQEIYLGIEHVRFADRLKVTFDIDEGLDNALVPSLILQPLIENAIKYAIAQRQSDGLLMISAHRAGKSLILTVRDNGPGQAEMPVTTSGVGLANTRERLIVLYGENARMVAGDHPEGGFEVRLTIPLEYAKPERSA